MDESDWDAVLRNCCLLYGWIIDKKTNRVVRAKTPAFQLKDKPVIGLPSKSSLSEETPPGTLSVNGPEISSQQSSPATPNGRDSENATNTDKSGDASKEPGSGSLIPLTAEDLETTLPKKLGALPSFAVNDTSRIEITSISSELQESMAKNHFSATSVETST